MTIRKPNRRTPGPPKTNSWKPNSLEHASIEIHPPAGKYAETLPGVDELFRTRWSPRSFSSQPVPPSVLEIILEAGRWAASCYNEQPWRFIVATKDDPAAFQSLLSVLLPFNQEWAKNAYVLILTVARANFSHNETPNVYALHDAGAALAHMMLQASASGVHAHAMAGFDHAKAREVAAVPPEFQIGAMVAMGYPDSADKLSSEELRKREHAPRTRKPLAQLAFKGRWGEALVK